jgi:glycosyltransferase involved in cell wall biosynthesis
MSARSNPVPVSEKEAVAPSFTGTRIAYDARFSLGEYRGMGRYLRRLIQPIAPNALGLAADGESDDQLQVAGCGFHFYPLWEQVSLPRRVAESEARWFIAPYNTAPLQLSEQVKLILVVHDFIYLRSRGEVPLSRSMYQNFGRIYRRWNVPRAIQRADHIICVSNTTRDELLWRFRVAAEKLCVIPNTIDTSWFQLRRQASPSRYILCVSGEAPNKNLDLGIRGFAAYVSSSHDREMQLKIVGVKPAFHARFQTIATQHGVRDRIELLPYVSDKQLQALYSGACAFFFPSRDEGFGIPILEALAAGVPVVASNCPSLLEVAASGALFSDPNSPAEMGDHLRTLLSDASLQRTLSARGRERALRFHPTSVDAEISAFWKRILERDE